MMNELRSPKNYPRVAWYDMAFLMFDLVCSITSGTMGAYFATASDIDSRCKVVGIPAFLIAGGSGNFALSTFRFLSPGAGSLLQLLFNLGMIVYGSVVAFGGGDGGRPAVDFNNPRSEVFCNYLPYRSALSTVVLLIVYFTSGILFYVCCCFWIYLCAGREWSDSWAYKYSSGYIYCSMHFITAFLKTATAHNSKKRRRKSTSLRALSTKRRMAYLRKEAFRNPTTDAIRSWDSSSFSSSLDDSHKSNK